MPNTERPRHEQISDWIRQNVEDGSWDVDHQLPSESQLGKRFSVSRITIRRALQTVENEGLIYRRQGLGSFVRGKTVEQGLVRLTDFVEDMRLAGILASSRVIATEHESADAETATALSVEAGTPVVRLDRLRLGDGEPIAFDQTWLTDRYWQYLADSDLTTRTIYHILEDDHNIPIRRGRFRISAIDAPAEIALQLHVPKGNAVLLIERSSFSESDVPVYYQRRFYRSDRVAYQLELERTEGAAPHRGGMPIQEFEPVFRNRT